MHISCMTQVAPPRGYADGQCNSYLPNDSVYTRFLYVIRYYARNGFYIILDNQLNLDTTAVDNPTVLLFFDFMPYAALSISV